MAKKALSRAKSNKKFKQGTKIERKNIGPLPTRGGTRL